MEPALVNSNDSQIDHTDSDGIQVKDVDVNDSEIGDTDYDDTASEDSQVDENDFDIYPRTHPALTFLSHCPSLLRMSGEYMLAFSKRLVVNPNFT
jgi:hypothetical protein